MSDGPSQAQAGRDAVAEADALGHTQLGTEHLLLGLLHEGEGVSSQVLSDLPLRLADVREGVRQRESPPAGSG